MMKSCPIPEIEPHVIQSWLDVYGRSAVNLQGKAVPEEFQLQVMSIENPEYLGITGEPNVNSKSCFAAGDNNSLDSCWKCCLIPEIKPHNVQSWLDVYERSDVNLQGKTVPEEFQLQ